MIKLKLSNKSKTTILLTIGVLICILYFYFFKETNSKQEIYGSHEDKIYCCENMMYCADALFSEKINAVPDYSQRYWWIEVSKQDLKPRAFDKLKKHFYCPLDKSKEYPSSYKINPNLRLSDFYDKDLQSESLMPLAVIPLEDRILVFYEDKDYHRKNYKLCLFLHGVRYLNDQEIVECIKSTRERIKRVKAKRKNL